MTGLGAKGGGKGRLAAALSRMARAVTKRRLAAFAIAFSVATVLWQIVPAWYFLLVPAVLLAVGVGFLRESRRVVAVLLTTGFLLGSAWCLGHDLLFLQPARELDRYRGEITVYVTSLPRETAYFTDVEGRLIRERGLSIPLRLRLDEAGEDLHPGDTIQVNAILYRADEIQGNRVWRHTANGIFLRAFASGEYRVLETGNRWWYFPQYASEAVMNQVARIFPEDAIGFVTAMLIGDLSLMDRQAYANIRESGIAHILAVSGMHVVFLSTMLVLLMGKSRKASIAAIPLIYIFVLMTGANPSVTRAALMQTMLLTAPIFDRENDGVTALSGSLFFILLFNPLAMASINLQLSFLAVLGMFAVTPRIYRYLNGILQTESALGGFAKKTIFSSIATTLGATALTAPALIFHFGAVSVYAALTNLLTVFPSSLVFFGGIIASTVGIVFVPLAQLIAIPVVLLSRYIEWVAAGIANFPMAVLLTYSAYIRLWLGVVAAISVFYFVYRGEKPRPFVPVSLCAGLLIYALFLGGLEARSGNLTVTALHVGQGQSVVLTTPEATILVDNGAGPGFAAGNIAAEYLFSRSIYALDFLILTHFHMDHVNGIGQLMRRMEIERLLIPDRPEGLERKDWVLNLAEEYGVPVYIIRNDTIYPNRMGTLTVFAPITARPEAPENNRGLSVLKTLGDFDVLITGDMYTDMEQRMIQLHNLPDVEVLLVGHHGSRTSTSAAFLEATLPEVAIISAGADNPHGHPHREVKLRLYSYGISIYRTDRSGHVTVRAG